MDVAGRDTEGQCVLAQSGNVTGRNFRQFAEVIVSSIIRSGKHPHRPLELQGGRVFKTNGSGQLRIENEKLSPSHISHMIIPWIQCVSGG